MRVTAAAFALGLLLAQQTAPVAGPEGPAYIDLASQTAPVAGPEGSAYSDLASQTAPVAGPEGSAYSDVGRVFRPGVESAPPYAQPPPQRGGGQGRGRGGIVSIALTTTAWPDGGLIPDKYAQPGHDVSPPFAWTNAPDTTVGFVLIAHDLDSPTGGGIDDFLHWLMWNIPGGDRALPEGLPQGATLANGARQMSATGPNYRGPAAPASGAPHHYVFELYALDTMLDVPAVGASPAQTRAAVMAAMAGHVRGKGVYTGTYRRTPNPESRIPNPQSPIPNLCNPQSL